MGREDFRIADIEEDEASVGTVNRLVLELIFEKVTDEGGMPPLRQRKGDSLGLKILI